MNHLEDRVGDGRTTPSEREALARLLWSVREARERLVGSPELEAVLRAYEQLRSAA